MDFSGNTKRNRLDAAYPISLQIPPSDLSCPPTTALNDARRGVDREYRLSTRSSRLNAVDVTRDSNAVNGEIYRILVDRPPRFDWTWEGAVACGIKTGSTETVSGDEAPDSGQPEGAWSGEIMEVDEVAGCIYVLIDDPKFKPRPGPFIVRPYEFLAKIHSVFCEKSAGFADLLGCRLGASCGLSASPVVSGNGLSACTSTFNELWKYRWGILWGPPGTGKTYSIGQQVAAALESPSERILVMSTTNKATDEAAVSIGNAVRQDSPALLNDPPICRIGKGANIERFIRTGLAGLLKGSETELMGRLAELRQQLTRESDPSRAAVIRATIKNIQREMKDAAADHFFSANTRVVVATAYKASMLLADQKCIQMIDGGHAPFTTVFLDEAGLISRAGAAFFSLLAARRFILAGDPRQLSPITRISRALDTCQYQWVGCSGLSHLTNAADTNQAVKLLTEQRRMDPTVCEFVSNYSYNKMLTTANDRETNPKFETPAFLKGKPRCIWYVPEEDTTDLAQVRASRGPGGTSWIRRHTVTILKLLFNDSAMKKADGLFVTPFRAQAHVVRRFFALNNLENWTASTIHAQQGAQAEIVIFDTVNTGAGWDSEEWRRLINVAISRAREYVIVISSRAEMNQIFLTELKTYFRPMAIVKGGLSAASLQRVTPDKKSAANTQIIRDFPDSLGARLARFNQVVPVMTAEQQRLCSRSVGDGGPRLVRGVAGSGKSLVMANWAIQLAMGLEQKANPLILVAYANASLKAELESRLEEAWQQSRGELPLLAGLNDRVRWDSIIKLHHIHNLLFGKYLPGFSVKRDAVDVFDYEAAAEIALKQLGGKDPEPVCEALFIDEAQDFGHSTLKLLTRYVKRTSETELHRPVYIFFDNAQNVYSRKLPEWKDLGLQMQGRSTVMTESFRSTRPITEIALNVLLRLSPPENDDPPGAKQEFQELVRRNLVERTTVDADEWWQVNYCQTEGLLPVFRDERTTRKQIDRLSKDLIFLFENEKVNPADVVIICLDKTTREETLSRLRQSLGEYIEGIDIQAQQPYQRYDRNLLITTPHSFKGHEAEIVAVVGIERFALAQSATAFTLYVAMTRARTHLLVYGSSGWDDGQRRIYNVVKKCFEIAGQRKVLVGDVEENKTPTAKAKTIVTQSESLSTRVTLDKKRETYAHAYKPWTPEDESILTEGYLKGTSVQLLADMLQRNQGAIRSRLRKLGLIE